MNLFLTHSVLIKHVFNQTAQLGIHFLDIHVIPETP